MPYLAKAHFLAIVGRLNDHISQFYLGSFRCLFWVNVGRGLLLSFFREVSGFPKQPLRNKDPTADAPAVKEIFGGRQKNWS